MKTDLNLVNKSYKLRVKNNFKMCNRQLKNHLLNRIPLCLFSLVFIFLITIFSPGITHAGPPFVTDDPEPVEYQHWEVYFAAQYEHNRDQDSSTLPHLEINYGVVPNVQIHLLAPLIYVKPEGKSSQYGYGDTELGIKFRFIKETDYIPQVAIFPLIELPTGNEDKGLGNGRTQYFLPVWLQKSFGAWTTYGGGGYWINPGAGNKDWWQWGWLIQRDINKYLTLGAELYYKTADTDDSNDTTGYAIGAIINFTENHHMLLSAGQDINGPNYLSVYVGYQFTFGPLGFGPLRKD
jgi:hypothetical protein